jgi:hypothetical protein
MKITKSLIKSKIEVKKKACSLTGVGGKYMVAIGEILFENDFGGRVFKNSSKKMFDWIDTGRTIQNKEEFMEVVLNDLQDEN